MTHDMLSPMTAEQLFALPSDGQKHELIAGELIVMSPAGSEHGIVIGNITAFIAPHVVEKKLGRIFGAESGFLIRRNPDTVRAPDVAFVTRERLERLGVPRSYWPGAPDLAVEVVSPSDRTDEVEEKVKVWLAAGCQEVWVASPMLRTVTLYRSLTEIELFVSTQSIDSSRVLPELRLAVADVFGGLK
jgi:Uma2 family endonuclease